MRSRKRLVLTTTPFLAFALAAQIAEAAPNAPPQSGPPRQSSSQFTLRREEAGGADASVARTRARAGDCAGALPAFDAAIRITIEPTLRRDRGLCHEKLNDPFPAMEDYRAYITSRPDAPDADQIRDRLARLEESVGHGGPSAQALRDRAEATGENTGAGAAAGATLTLGREGGSEAGDVPSSGKKAARADEMLGPRPGEESKSYDYYAAQERLLDQADSSPLRFGTGWEIGPFLNVPRYFIGSGVNKDPAYSVGAAIRYSFSPSLTFITEFGYAGIGQAGATTSASGPLLFAGLEVRIPLDHWASNQLVLGVGPGFERYTNSGTQEGIDLIEGRARFGYRHVFGAAVGLEFLLDGGPVYFKPTGVSGSAGDGKLYGTVGGSYALVIGF